MKRVYLEGNDYHHDDEIGFKTAIKVYPEGNIDDCINRLKVTCDRLTKKYEKSEKKVLHLIATHAAVVKCVSSVYGAKMRNEWCKYCAFTGVEING